VGGRHARHLQSDVVLIRLRIEKGNLCRDQLRAGDRDGRCDNVECHQKRRDEREDCVNRMGPVAPNQLH
jgi:hypothetical protein